MADLIGVNDTLPVRLGGVSTTTGIPDNYAEVKAGSTAAATTDSALVVALSPNSPLPAGTNVLGAVTFNDSTPATQTITALDTGTASLVGANGQTFFVGTPTVGSTATFTLASTETVAIEATFLGTGGTLEVEVSSDSGALWLRPVVFQPSTQSYTNGFTAPFMGIVNVSGMTNIRVRGTVSWSGTVTILIRESLHTRAVVIGDALPPGANTIGAVNQSGTWNVNNVSGTVSLPTGAATSANQATEISSLQLIDNPIGSVGAGTAGTSSYLTGGVFNTALPTLTTSEQAAIQLDSSGRQLIAPLTNASIVKAQLQDNSGNALLSVNSQIENRDVINVSSQYRAQSITNTAAQALGAATILANRKVITITPTNGTIYWGTNSSVTTATGTPLFANQTLTLAFTDNVSVFVISAGTVDARIMEAS